MSRTVLANVDGFTPIIDSLVDDVGIIGAAVFGRIWRFCQMERGICHASLGTIALDLGLSTRTVIRHSDILVSKGYLKDMTPDLRNVPHTYADTGKAAIRIDVVGMTESHTRHDTKSHRYDRKSQPAMTESHLKIEDKIEDKIENTAPSPKSKTREIQTAYESCVTFPIDWKKNEGHAAKWLADNGYTPEDVIACYKSMKADKFWADKPLTLSSVKNAIGEWKTNGAKPKGITIRC
jgi:hypothetical protein